MAYETVRIRGKCNHMSCYDTHYTTIIKVYYGMMVTGTCYGACIVRVVKLLHDWLTSVHAGTSRVATGFKLAF